MGKTEQVKYKLSAIDGLSRVIKGARGQMKGLKKDGISAASSLGRFGKSVGRGFGRSVGILSKGALGFAAVGAATGGVLAKSISASSEYENALVGVGKTTNLQGQALAKFGEKFRALSREIPVTQTKLLGFAKIGAQLGAPVEHLEKFADTMARLESATDLQGDDGAMALATIFNNTREGPEIVDRMGASIVSLGNNFNTTEGQIARMGSELVRGAGVFNVKSADILAISAAASDLGVQAEAGGTVLTRAFQNIDAAVRRGGKGMYELSQITGLSAEEIKKRYGGKNGAANVFQKFIESLGDIKGSEGDVVRALERFGLSGARVSKVLVPLAANSERLTETMKLSRKSFKENKALVTESAAAWATFSSRVLVAKNRLRDAFISTGQRATFGASDLLGGFSAVMNNPETKGIFEGLGDNFSSNMIALGGSLKEAFGGEGATGAQALAQAMKGLQVSTDLFFFAIEQGGKLLATFSNTLVHLQAILDNGLSNSFSEAARGMGIAAGEVYDHLKSKGLQTNESRTGAFKFSSDKMFNTQPIQGGQKNRQIEGLNLNDDTAKNFKKSGAAITVDFKNLPAGATVEQKSDLAPGVDLAVGMQ